jgi:simple sugar transport system ATP-binding protein
VPDTAHSDGFRGAAPLPILRACGISKAYGRVQANANVDLDVYEGEIHALLGENGAGKSTLMRILYGMEAPDEGTVEFGGEQRRFNSPRDAIDAGIGMVHQHFTLVPTLTVLENVILGTPLAGVGWLRLRHARRAVVELAARYHISVDVDAKVSQTSVGEQQRVEILKALVRGAKVLILDEPTAVLTPHEVVELATTLKQQTRKGLAIFIVTHKLPEVMEMADRVSVMRLGKLVGTWNIGATTPAELVTLMIGRSRQEHLDRQERAPGRPILYLNRVSALGGRGRTALDGATLTVHAGEIVGVAGVEGNGQTELAEVITGLRALTAGDVVLDGRSIRDCSTAEILNLGVAHVPQDRHHDALVLDFSVAENAILIEHGRRQFSRYGLVAAAEAAAFTSGLVASFDIRCSGPQARMRSLSGGNQQKLILGRELAREPKLLIAMQPTRGLDVAAIDYVHARIIAHRNAGTAVLLVSTELDEVLALSDRVAVLRQGRFVAVIDRDGASVDAIGPLMLGSRAEAAA